MPRPAPEKVPPPKGTPKTMLETPADVGVAQPAEAPADAQATPSSTEVSYVVERPRFRLFRR
jgi:hypothetical protein